MRLEERHCRIVFVSAFVQISPASFKIRVLSLHICMRKSHNLHRDCVSLAAYW